MVEKRLGRGLDFLLSEGQGQEPQAGRDEVTQVELSSLVPSPYQPRKEFADDELKELSDSIRASGVLQPILVRRVGEKHELIAGERRWRAATMAGLERIPALVREVTDEMAAVFGLVENLQRADLNAIEKAKAFSRIQALTKGTQEDVARQVGLSRAAVANFQRLLDLPEEIQAHVSRGTLSMGHARALLALRDPQEQLQLADEILRQRLSVRKVEALVQDLGQPQDDDKKGPKKKRGPKKREPWVQEIEETLADAVGTTVAVNYTDRRSRITIECLGRDEFERVYDLLKAIER